MVPLAFGWRHVLFANWPVPADVLAPHLPDALSVQEFDGSGWLSVVPFTNVDVRPRGLPKWSGVPLREVNVRTYVTCDGEPGVYFFSLDAQGLLSVVGARLTHHLPYYYARIRLRAENDRVAFASRRRHPGARPARYEASYAPASDRYRAEEGSLAAFLVERRRLYTQATDGSVRYTDIEHGRWPLYDATVSEGENTLLAASGFDRPSDDPTCYYSPGVDVVTTRSKQWREAV